jgi:hypothetical protein
VIRLLILAALWFPGSWGGGIPYREIAEECVGPDATHDHQANECECSCHEGPED